MTAVICEFFPLDDEVQGLSLSNIALSLRRANKKTGAVLAQKSDQIKLDYQITCGSPVK